MTTHMAVSVALQVTTSADIGNAILCTTPIGGPSASRVPLSAPTIPTMPLASTSAPGTPAIVDAAALAAARDDALDSAALDGPMEFSQTSFVPGRITPLRPTQSTTAVAVPTPETVSVAQPTVAATPGADSVDTSMTSVSISP